MKESTDKTLLIDGADKAICGLVHRCGQVPIVIYEHNKLVKHFIQSGMSLEDAQEWIEFNIIGAWVGNGTPGILFKANASSIKEQLDESL